MKRTILGYGIGTHSKHIDEEGRLRPKTCFVTGQKSNGVGDHLYPMRNMWKITHRCGSTSQWNLIPVISSMNQGYTSICIWHKDTGKFLSQAQVGLHLVDDDKNLLDGIPLKILEYVAYGLHVVCSDSEAWRNEFSKIPTCHFTDPTDYENIETILENINSESSHTTKQAKEILKSEYSWEAQFSILTSVYDRILKDV